MQMLFRRRRSTPLLSTDDDDGADSQERWTPTLVLSCIAVAMGQATICCYFLQWSCITKVAPEIIAYTRTEFPLALSFYSIALIFVLLIAVFLRNTQKDKISDRKAFAFLELAHAIVMFFLSYLLSFGSTARDIPGMFFWPTSCPLVAIVHGVELLITPAMLVELAPVRLRGRCASFQSIFFGIGFGVATFAYSMLADQMTALWHFLNIFAIVTHALQAFLLYFCCAESPRWLVHKQQYVKATEALKLLGRRDTELDEMKRAAEEYEKSKRGRRFNFFVCLCSKCELGLPLFIGVSIALVHLITTGFFIGEIFRGDAYRNIAGLSLSNNPLGINTPGLASGRIAFLLAGFICNLVFVDRIGRRPLMIGGLASMAISLFILAIGLHYQNYPAVIAGHFSYAIANSVGPGPISAFMIAEMFAPAYRIAANSFSIILAFLADFGVQMFARRIFGDQSIRECEIVILALVCFIELVVLYMIMPETCRVPMSDIVKRLTHSGGGSGASEGNSNAAVDENGTAAASAQQADAIPMEEMARY